LTIAPGASIAFPIRFQPTTSGLKTSTLTVFSDDPAGPKSVTVWGDSGTGKLAVTGSAFFGRVPACTTAERTLSICNVGDCRLHVSSVAFRHPNRHWKLINNPFPATLHPGASLDIVLRYSASEEFPRSCDLVITSDDPFDRVKIVEVIATTVWDECCNECCPDCRERRCGKRHCEPCACRKCSDRHKDRDHPHEDPHEE
jgi:hypothetical protein